MEACGVARMTARHALSVLQSEGLTVTQHGRGVFVRGKPPVYRYASDRFTRENRQAGGAFAAEMTALGRIPRQEILGIEELAAPAFVAERLRLRGNAKVLVRRRRMWADEVPMQLADSYFPAKLVRGTSILNADAGPGGSYARLEELGRGPVHFREELVSRMPTEHERQVLMLEAAATPVVELIRTAFDASGDAIEVFISVAAGDKQVFVYEFDAS
jgi:GntR family transcriptional regulator